MSTTNYPVIRCLHASGSIISEKVSINLWDGRCENDTIANVNPLNWGRMNEEQVETQRVSSLYLKPIEHFNVQLLSTCPNGHSHLLIVFPLEAPVRLEAFLQMPSQRPWRPAEVARICCSFLRLSALFLGLQSALEQPS